jgi:hypothetical protein
MAGNDQKDDLKLWLNTSQINASTLAIYSHHQDAKAKAGDWPSDTPTVHAQFVEVETRPFQGDASSHHPRSPESCPG